MQFRLRILFVSLIWKAFASTVTAAAQATLVPLRYYLSYYLRSVDQLVGSCSPLCQNKQSTQTEDWSPSKSMEHQHVHVTHPNYTCMLSCLLINLCQTTHTQLEKKRTWREQWNAMALINLSPSTFPKTAHICKVSHSPTPLHSAAAHPDNVNKLCMVRGDTERNSVWYVYRYT